MTARSDHGFGNPDAKPLVSRPEASSSGRQIAPAPPGQVSYISNRCGYPKANGEPCTNYPVKGNEYCLPHLKVVSRDQS